MILNLNVGLLGHVDSGKTTLAKVLSQVASTAAFDKNPQSQERGITLDLGFSAYCCDLPEHLKTDTSQYDQLQLTFVDCPGHAKLIRTIIGGSQIIDLMILVVDINRGIQTQTAECLVIGELTCKRLLVALNKIDLLEQSKAARKIDKVTAHIQRVLAETAFENVQIVPISALQQENLSGFLEVLTKSSYIPHRDLQLPFVFAVDHCFAIRGQGTVCTGTVLQGRCQLNEDIEITATKQIKKIKSIQMFRKSMNAACKGERAGICITQFDPKLLERGLIAKPGYLMTVSVAIVRLNKIKYYVGAIKSKSKFHITIGHENVMADIVLFASNKLEDAFSWTNEYEYVPEITTDSPTDKTYFALLEFEKPITVMPETLLIASKLDMDVNTNHCRLGFWGNLRAENSCTDLRHYQQTFLPNLKLFKEKTKQGTIQRVVSGSEIIVDHLFKKESLNRQLFVGLKVQLSSGGQWGTIESTFGATTKVRVRLTPSLPADVFSTLKTTPDQIKVILKFKKYLYNKDNKMIQ